MQPLPYLNGHGGDQPAYRPPPYNIEAERAFLGAILIDNRAFAAGADLAPDDFYIALHREVFRLSGEMIRAGRIANAITLKPYLEDAEPVDAGTTAVQYLGTLGAAAATTDPHGYAHTIKQCALLRQLVWIGENVAADAASSHVERSAEEKIGEAIVRLRSLSSEGGSLRAVTAASFAGKPIPPRAWHARDVVPANDATQLGGDGGTGKSILAAQLAVATVLGRPWLGLEVKRGPVVYLGAEDDIDEMHRRFAAIARQQDIGLDRLAELNICCLAGQDATLATADETGAVRPTMLWHQFEQTVAEVKPALVVYDTLADLFGGDENRRGQARRFVGMLRGLAIETRSAALLLTHPSLTGLSTGSGTSGSTGWSNSVRSRLYLERVKDGAREPDPNARVLRTMKANYGPVGGEIRLRWHEGVFLLESEDAAGAAAAAALSAHDDAVFLRLLDEFTEAGRSVGATPGVSYAPARFAEAPEGKAIGQKRLVASMARLFDRGAIKQVDYGRPSRPHRRLEAA